jgi:glycerol kinase
LIVVVVVGCSEKNFFKDTLRLIESYAALDTCAGEVDDNGGITFVPCLGGLFAPHWRPDARGTLLGLSQHTSRGHIVRAALEGIALQTSDVLQAIRCDVAPIVLESLKVDGGLSASRVLLAFQARAADVEVWLKRGHVEATALGAARAAALADRLLTYPQCASETSKDAWEVFPADWSKEERESALTRWSAAVQRALPLDK